MKNINERLYLFVIAIIFSIVVVMLSINSQYPSGIGINRIPFDYAWFDVYVYSGSIFLVLGTLILILSCKSVHDLYHSGIIKNMIQREKFLKIKLKNLFQLWSNSLFLYPIFLIFSYIICYFIFPTRGIGINIVVNGPMINSILILLRACIITTIYSIFVFNVTLIISKKTKSFAITSILSFIVIMVYAGISQLLISNILKTFTSEQFAKGFDLINGLIFGFGNTLSILIHGTILIIITTLVLNKIYGNVNEAVLNYEDEN